MASFKLDKDQRAQRDELIAQLRSAADELEAAVTTFNAALAEAKAPLQAAVTSYNDALGLAREFSSDIASQADSDISDKTERWQEGEKGQAANAWKEEWEALTDEFEDIDLELPEPIDLDITAHAVTLEEANMEATS